MRYFMLALLMFVFVGCGGGNSSDKRPSSPDIDDISKKPPALPLI